MLKNSAIESLEKKLALALQSFGLHSETMGQPELVEKASKESEKIFQGFAKSAPSKAEAYAAALTFMRGQLLDDWQYDLISGVLCEPILEHRNATLLGHPKFSSLLKKYETEANSGELWWLTWYGLLGSYFSFKLLSASTAEKEGWSILRALLQKTWPGINKEFKQGLIPDWAVVLRKNEKLLTEDAAQGYGLNYLRGESKVVQELAIDLGIPETSWFYHRLVLAAVSAASERDDSEFKAFLPKLIALVEERAGFRDDAIERILIRFKKSSDTAVHPQLRDYVVRKDVWRNPKLKDSGEAPAWNRVPDVVWKMVLSWVNEGNLRDFFDLLAARNKADHGRLAFWSAYMKQISWTRLVFGRDTLQLAQKNIGVRNLIAREEGAYATLTANHQVDAFIMQIGKFIIVEFTQTGNAAYAYQADKLPFKQYARTYSGGTDDLKHGFRGKPAARITHQTGWERDAAADLKSIGIYPDNSSSFSSTHGSSSFGSAVSETNQGSPRNEQSSTRMRAPKGAKFTLISLRELVSEFNGARVVDERTQTGSGRLWVQDASDSFELTKKLQLYGFEWSSSRKSWYFPE